MDITVAYSSITSPRVETRGDKQQPYNRHSHISLKWQCTPYQNGNVILLLIFIPT